MTLPAWTYHHEEFLALEKEALFLRSWQLVGHVSEVENPGDYLRFDLLGESAIVVRDARGGLRAFHNVCRHRASRLLKQRAGHCGTLITCPYHGFSYDLGGRLVAVVGVEDFDELDKSQHALVPLELEVHLGLIFVRFLADEGPSVARQLAPFEALLKGYLIADMRPLAPLTTQVLHANWKVAVENTLEAYHVATAHPRLKQLLAGHETLELRPFGAICWRRSWRGAGASGITSDCCPTFPICRSPASVPGRCAACFPTSLSSSTRISCPSVRCCPWPRA